MLPIGRHPRDRLKMAVVGGGKKPSRIIVCASVSASIRWCNASWKPAAPIRFACTWRISAILWPGDPVYGGKPRLLPLVLQDALQLFDRQAMHAGLALVHLGSGKAMLWKAPLPLPDDFLLLLDAMRADRDGVMPV